MVNGITSFGGIKSPCKNIETQVQEIFDSNKNYKYVDLVYKPIDNVVNMRYATLIVESLN
jgi:hypothetical protein